MGPGWAVPYCFIVAEIQRDLDAFMTYYNLERSHQGYRLRGRTPAQALREALGLEHLPNLRFETPSEDTENNRAWPLLFSTFGN